MRYYILDDEKIIIQKMLDEEFRNKVNFVIDDVYNNILDEEEVDKYKVAFRELEEITKVIECTYSACKKQMINSKSEKADAKKLYGDKIEFDTLDKAETIYVPISLSKLNNIANNKDLNIFLEGTIGKFIAESKTYDDVEDMVILKLDNVTQPYFAATDEYSDILARLIMPSFKLIVQMADLNRANDLMISNIESRKNDSRIEKIRPTISGIIKRTDVLKYEDDLDYLESEEEKDRNVQDELDKKYNEILNAKENEDKDKVENDGNNKNDDNEEKDENDDSYNVEEKDETEVKTNDNIEKMVLFDEGMGQYNNFKNFLEIREERKNLALELEHYIKFSEGEKDTEQREKNNKKIKKVEKEIEERKEAENKILDDIAEYKEKYIGYLEKRFVEIDKKMAKQTVESYEDIDDLEIIKYMDVEKALRQNLNRINKILDDIEGVIAKQKKFAKIGADTRVKYSSIIDAFEIKEVAESLKSEIKKMYDDFEEFYFNKVNKKITDDNYEKKLGKILDTSLQVQSFLNDIYNPRTAKKRANIDRFDELVLIEENELKRMICKTVENTIAEGNLLIIDDEVSKIENRPAYRKIYDIITGNNKAEEYRQMRLEEATDDIQKKLDQVYTINTNYKIHDILAELMIFKAENIEDDMLNIYVSKLSDIEKGIGKNFVIDEDKVLEKIYDLKSLNLPINIENASKEEKIDIEISMLYKKYGYSDIPDEKEVEYVDNTKDELKKILDYIKVSI